jgi:hypothetical protein
MSDIMVPLLVTTEHKGVFFGYGQATDERIIRLERARMCVHWDSGVRGVLGLAATGPNANCRVGPAVPEIVLQGVTAVVTCSEEAREQWEQNHWA